MDIKAHARYIRISPRRVRLVADVIRGLPVERAGAQLFAISRRATVPLKKLLASAVANAEQNFDCVRENLYVKGITVEEGPTLKRYRPRAFGRATSIRKRSAHITLVLAEREEGKRGGRARREEARAARHPKQVHGGAQSPAIPKSSAPSPEARTTHRATPVVPSRVAKRHHVEGAKEHARGSEKQSKGFLKRLFSRKTG